MSTEQQHLEWLARSAAGDVQAFESLYRDLVRPVYKYLRSRLNREQDIQDVMQETFVTLWRTAGQFRGESICSTWVLGIARHKLLDRLRVDYRTREREVQSLETDSKDGKHFEIREYTAGNPGQVDTKLAWQQALQTLDKDAQELAYLVFIEQLSYKEIATLLEIPAGTVKSRVYHLRQRLKQLLREEVSEDDDEVQ